jgi:UPF0755 protein
MKKAAGFLFLTGCVVFIWFNYLGAPSSRSEEKTFIIAQKNRQYDPVADLAQQKLIKNERVFRFLMEQYAKLKEVQPGGYRLNRNMNAFDVLKKLAGKPDLVWVTTGACLRREQIGEILADKLGWDYAQVEKWNSAYEKLGPEYAEGVYYPDTYLLPVDESPELIAKRYVNRFNEKFAPYADRYLEANIRWVTGLKIASLIAREAAGKDDMHLISGVIWNRLDIGMPLQIDATMQYTAGKREDGSWWGAIDIDEKQKDSPYNSYLYKGLPPTPICSPNIDYVEAALNPKETDCLFYLHDANGRIHCSVTYEEHLENIDTFL